MPTHQLKMSGRLRSRYRIAAAVGVAAALIIAVLGPLSHGTASAETGLFASSTTPRLITDPDTQSVELGVRFSTTVSGTITGIRYYRGPQNAGPHVGTLWSGDGRVLARVTFSNETATGWQTTRFATPVPVRPRVGYVASYLAPSGRYAGDVHAFDRARKSGSLRMPDGAGVYSYTPGAFPARNYLNTNYYVDVLFEPGTTTAPVTTSPTPTGPGSTLPSATSTPAPTMTGSPTVPVTLAPVDGDTDYYARFTNGLPTAAAFFPIGVWLESVLETADVTKDQQAGINTYVDLTSNSDASIVRRAGSYALPSFATSAASGRILTDEADMWAGPGSASWAGGWPGTGTICVPSGAQCGYTVMETLQKQVPAGLMSYANYGKSVTFWETETQAARFVSIPDVVSADNYWFTDPGICGATEGGWGPGTGVALPTAQCRLAANYGWTVDRLRSLEQPIGSKPVWAFVEVGHPFTESDAPTATGPQIRAAVWSSIIHGARGIIYFNHDFGGPCISQHVLRDVCGASVRPTVTAVDQQIQQLAPVLNAPTVEGLLTHTGAVDTMVKASGGSFFVFAGSAQAASQTVRFTSECTTATTATVVGETRSIPISNGSFSDGFADGKAVHIYRLDGGTCGV